MNMKGKIMSRVELTGEVIRLRGDVVRLTALAYRSSVLLAILEINRNDTNFTYTPSTTCPTKSGSDLNVRSEDLSIFKLPTLDALYHQDLVRNASQSLGGL